MRVKLSTMDIFMRTRRLTVPLLMLGFMGVMACEPSPPEATQESTPAMSQDAQQIASRIQQYAPVDIGVDLGTLPQSERDALAKIVAASRLLDTLFLRQVWAGNEQRCSNWRKTTRPTARRSCTTSSSIRGRGIADSAASRASFYRWRSIGSPSPNGIQPTFYPADASKDEIEHWIAGLSGDARAQATGFFTVIRRNPQGKLVTVPYSASTSRHALGRGRAAARRRRAHRQPTLKNS